MRVSGYFIIAIACLSFVAGCNKQPGDPAKVAGKWDGEPKTSKSPTDVQAALAKMWSAIMTPRLVLNKDMTFKMNMITPEEGHYEYMGDTITLKVEKVMGMTKDQYKQAMSSMPFSNTDEFTTHAVTVGKDGNSLTLDTPDGMPDVVFHRGIADDQLKSTVQSWEKPLVGNWSGTGQSTGMMGGPMNVDLDLKQDNTFDVSMPFPESGKWTIASGQLQLFTTEGQMVMTGTFTTDAKTLNMMADQTPITLTRSQ